MVASASIIPSNPTATAKFPTTSTAATTSLSPPSSLKFASISPNYPSTKPLISHSALPHFQHKPLSAITPPNASTTPPPTVTASIFHGICYVVGDNIDTDQIIAAKYLTLVLSNPEEYKKLKSYALTGLPSSYQTRFVEPDQFKSNYSIVIGGDNFGCGSSRKHAPVVLGAAGVAAVVAESYARIFFKNSVATGEIFLFSFWVLGGYFS
nr:3-isopropylmalate dehydratase small subunit 3-like [Coffea arabica]